MIIFEQGDNVISLPRQDIELGEATAIRFTEVATKAESWCKAEDTEEMVDFLCLGFTVVLAGADPQQGEVSLHEGRKGEYTVDVFTGDSYSPNPNEMQLMRTERGRYV